jgi:hypothetical protein
MRLVLSRTDASEAEIFPGNHQGTLFVTLGREPKWCVVEFKLGYRDGTTTTFPIFTELETLRTTQRDRPLTCSSMNKLT